MVFDFLKNNQVICSFFPDWVSKVFTLGDKRNARQMFIMIVYTFGLYSNPLYMISPITAIKIGKIKK
jgi:hypothetical protein